MGLPEHALLKGLLATPLGDPTSRVLASAQALIHPIMAQVRASSLAVVVSDPTFRTSAKTDGSIKRKKLIKCTRGLRDGAP